MLQLWYCCQKSHSVHVNLSCYIIHLLLNMVLMQKHFKVLIVWGKWEMESIKQSGILAGTLSQARAFPIEVVSLKKTANRFVSQNVKLFHKKEAWRMHYLVRWKIQLAGLHCVWLGGFLLWCSPACQSLVGPSGSPESWQGGLMRFRGKLF